LIYDGKNYPVKAGDAIYIPRNVDHYTLNDGGEGVMRRIAINPLEAARSGGASNNGGQGTGEVPVNRNESALNRTLSHVLLNTEDGVPNYVMLHNDPMEQEQLATLTPEDTHAWEHVVFLLEGSGTLVCNGKNYTVSKNDAPPNSEHEWRSNRDQKAAWQVFNPIQPSTLRENLNKGSQS